MMNLMNKFIWKANNTHTHTLIHIDRIHFTHSIRMCSGSYVAKHFTRTQRDFLPAIMKTIVYNYILFLCIHLFLLQTQLQILQHHYRKVMPTWNELFKHIPMMRNCRWLACSRKFTFFPIRWKSGLVRIHSWPFIKMPEMKLYRFLHFNNGT